MKGDKLGIDFTVSCIWPLLHMYYKTQ